MLDKIIRMFAVIIFSLCALISALVLWTFAALGGSNVINLSTQTVIDSPLGQLGVSFLTLLINVSGLYLMGIICIVGFFSVLGIFEDELVSALKKFERMKITFPSNESKSEQKSETKKED